MRNYIHPCYISLGNYVIILAYIILPFHHLGDPHFVAGKHVVVLGRSKIVGAPAAQLFLWHHATVTVCHSKTQKIEEHCRRADILIVAIGKKHFVKGKNDFPIRKDIFSHLR